MNALPRDYDAWCLSDITYESDEVGIEDGQTCNRYPEPDEDAPRGWQPRPCDGAMTEVPDSDETALVCDRCGEVA